ncbi:MAG: SMC-Scp complex subunit ScpB [Christensenellaceae bacterium]|jgi:segregation and condensation protein B
MEHEKIIGIIENILFTAGTSVSIAEIAEAIEYDKLALTLLIEAEIEARKDKSGLVIRRLEDKIQLATRTEYGGLLRDMFGEKNEKALSTAMLETLSIIAYEQPVTRGDIEEIRGVNTSYTLNLLVERALVEEAGRKDTLGRPILYRTSEAFLRQFGIASLEELPEIELFPMELAAEKTTQTEDALDEYLEIVQGNEAETVETSEEKL